MVPPPTEMRQSGHVRGRSGTDDISLAARWCGDPVGAARSMSIIRDRHIHMPASAAKLRPFVPSRAAHDDDKPLLPWFAATHKACITVNRTDFPFPALNRFPRPPPPPPPSPHYNKVDPQSAFSSSLPLPSRELSQTNSLPLSLPPTQPCPRNPTPRSNNINDPSPKTPPPH